MPEARGGSASPVPEPLPPGTRRLRSRGLRQRGAAPAHTGSRRRAVGSERLEGAIPDDRDRSGTGGLDVGSTDGMDRAARVDGIRPSSLPRAAATRWSGAIQTGGPQESVPTRSSEFAAADGKITVGAPVRGTRRPRPARRVSGSGVSGTAGDTANLVPAGGALTRRRGGPGSRPGEEEGPRWGGVIRGRRRVRGRGRRRRAPAGGCPP